MNSGYSIEQYRYSHKLWLVKPQLYRIIKLFHLYIVAPSSFWKLKTQTVSGIPYAHSPGKISTNFLVIRRCIPNRFSSFATILSQDILQKVMAFEFSQITSLRKSVLQLWCLVVFREFVSLSDGGHVALDWAENDFSVIDSSNCPTVIILPGLNGKQALALILFKSLKLFFRFLWCLL